MLPPNLSIYMLGDRLCENPLLTSITFLIGIHGYTIFIMGLFHNKSARNLLTAKTIYDGLEQQRYLWIFIAIYRHLYFGTPDYKY